MLFLARMRLRRSNFFYRHLMIFTAALLDLHRQKNGNVKVQLCFLIGKENSYSLWLTPYASKRVTEWFVYIPVLSQKYIRPLQYIPSLMLNGGSRDEATSKRRNKWIFHRSLRRVQPAAPWHRHTAEHKVLCSSELGPLLRARCERTTVTADGRDWGFVKDRWANGPVSIFHFYFWRDCWWVVGLFFLQQLILEPKLCANFVQNRGKHN